MWETIPTSGEATVYVDALDLIKAMMAPDIERANEIWAIYENDADKLAPALLGMAQLLLNDLQDILADLQHPELIATLIENRRRMYLRDVR